MEATGPNTAGSAAASRHRPGGPGVDGRDACYKSGERSRLIYAIREYRCCKDEPKGFGWKDYHDLIIRARTPLGSPIVLVWDNLRIHLVAPLREFFEANAG